MKDKYTENLKDLEERQEILVNKITQHLLEICEEIKGLVKAMNIKREE